MNAFARSNLGVATLRLLEATTKLTALEARIARRAEPLSAVHKDERDVRDAAWSVREAARLIEAATTLEDLESADTLPSPPESGVKGAAR